MAQREIDPGDHTADVRCSRCGKPVIIYARNGVPPPRRPDDDPPVYLCGECRADSAEWDDEEFLDETARGRA